MSAAIVLLFLVVGLWPSDAWAWGPYAHLDFGHQVLKNLSLLPAHMRALLQAFPFDYLYGCIYADVIIGKNRATFAKHCHNWKVAFDIFHHAETLRQRAFMLGYLSHLAADIIAHNYFVPFKIVESWPTRFLKHLFPDEPCYVFNRVAYVGAVELPLPKWALAFVEGVDDQWDPKKPDKQLRVGRCLEILGETTGLSVPTKAAA